MNHRVMGAWMLFGSFVIGLAPHAEAFSTTDTLPITLSGKEWCRNDPSFFEPIYARATNGITLTITRDPLNNGDVTNIQAHLNNTGNATIDAITFTGKALPANTSGSTAQLILSGTDPGNPRHFLVLRGQATFGKFGKLTKVTGTFAYQILDAVGGIPNVDCFGNGTFTTLRSPSPTSQFAFALLYNNLVTNTVTNLVLFSTGPGGTLHEVSKVDLQTSQETHISGDPRIEAVVVVTNSDDSTFPVTPAQAEIVSRNSSNHLVSACGPTLLGDNPVVREPVILPQRELVYIPAYNAIYIYATQGNTCLMPIFNVFFGPLGGNDVLSVAASSDETRLYALIHYVSGGYFIQSLSINSNGSLGGLSYLVINAVSPNRLQLHPSGRLIYIADSSTISVFSVDTSGQFQLGPVSGAALPYFVIHPSGNFLYGVSNATGQLEGYSIDQTNGALTQLPNPPKTIFPGGERLAFSPSGDFLYVGSSEGLFVYQVQNNGSLKQVQQIPTGVSLGGWDEVVLTE